MDSFTIDFKLFTEICYRLLVQIKDRGIAYDSILCPLRGGFYLSDFFSRKLNIPVVYLEINSYSESSQGEFYIKIKPDSLNGRVLLCDDIYDTGNTIRHIRELFPHAEFDTVCIASKDENADLIYGIHVEKKRWVNFFWEII